MHTGLEQLTAALSDRYRIERELGQGGMATVYLAHDVRHDRKVALKVLKPELSAILGAERFLHEIKTTANLQHPHILSLFDSGEAGGFVFYVMPYVEGESLRDRLMREKQLPVEDAVRIAREVADALEYAHQHHVVHRDIKPENILLHGGHAMVADFGIALAASRSDGSTRMTETGMSLGTPHYMSPEQAMGEREITPRSDIYALGCVLYEMLTAEPPFVGATAQAIIARVLTEEPRSLTLQRKSIPPHVEAVVMHALEKLPADRFATAAEFGKALGDAGYHGTGFGPHGTVALRTGRGSRVAGRGVWAAGAVALIFAVLAVWGWFRPRPSTAPHPVVRFAIQLPSDAPAGGALGSTIALSPDGGTMVYVAQTTSGSRLQVRRMDQPDPNPLPGGDGGTLPFFSRDGNTVGFTLGAKLVRVSLAGGSVTPITAGAQVFFGASWTPDDSVVFATDSGLMVVSAEGGGQRLIARPERGEQFHFPEVLPDGKAVLFGIVGHGTLKLGALVRRTGEIKRFQQAGGYPRYISGGFVVLNDPGGVVVAVRFDPTRLEVIGTAGTLIDHASPSSDGDWNLGVSQSGDFAYQFAPTEGSRLVLVDRQGNARPIRSDSGNYYFPRFSPDGHLIAVISSPTAAPNPREIWLIDPKQGTRTRVTFDSVALFPFWSPDGRRIGYSAFTPPNAPIMWIPADGSGPAQPLVASPGVWAGSGFEPGGGGLVYFGADVVDQPAAKSAIWRRGIGADTSSRSVLATPFSNTAPTLSPDGRWFAYASNESGRSEIYVRPYPGPGGRWQVSLDGGTQPRWSPTGNEIFYRNSSKMMAAAVRTREGFAVGERATLFSATFIDPIGGGVPAYDVSPDGRSFLMLQSIVGRGQDIVVTMHWFDNLARTP